MKSSYSSQLIDFLMSDDAESIYKCDLITISLSQLSQTFYVTNGQMPITFGGHLFQPNQFGTWAVDSVSCKIGCMNSTCMFHVYADPEKVMPSPSTMTVLQAISAGLFEGATITVQVAYMQTYGNTTITWNGSSFSGVATKFIGQISKFASVGLTQAKGQAEPYTYMLNQPMPRMVLQPGCRWQLYGAGCTAGKSTYSFAASAQSPSLPAFIYALESVLTQAPGYFTQGVLTFTGGKNSGLSYGVKAHTQAVVSGTTYAVLQLDRPTLLPVAAADTFTVSAGCDHTQITCLQKFNNLINFGGTPYIPDYNTAV